MIRLAWSDLLKNDQELNELLTRYENELKTQLLIQEEKHKRSLNSPNRNPRETLIWDMISQNFIASYKTELDWVQDVRGRLFKHQINEEQRKMNYQIIDGPKKYLEVMSAATPISTENDALELVALCGENDTNLLMIHYTALSKDFFKLKTKVAGNILQKLMNYHIKAVAVIPNEITQEGRFRELVLETNKGNYFRMYESKDDAEQWLLQ